MSLLSLELLHAAQIDIEPLGANSHLELGEVKFQFILQSIPFHSFGPCLVEILWPQSLS